eukprot:374814-Amphidinium_carterae.1
MESAPRLAAWEVLHFHTCQIFCIPRPRASSLGACEAPVDTARLQPCRDRRRLGVQLLGWLEGPPLSSSIQGALQPWRASAR